MRLFPVKKLCTYTHILCLVSLSYIRLLDTWPLYLIFVGYVPLFDAMMPIRIWKSCPYVRCNDAFVQDARHWKVISLANLFRLVPHPFIYWSTQLFRRSCRVWDRDRESYFNWFYTFDSFFFLNFLESRDGKGRGQSRALAFSYSCACFLVSYILK